LKDTIAKQLLACLLLIGLLLPVFETLAGNSPQIHVLGLFRDKALLKVNGNRLLLKAGEEAVEGVRLIDANSRMAILEVNGERKKYGLGSQVSTHLTEPESTVVRILSKQGMYTVSGLINGKQADFLVDTGATLVTMARPTADRLQIRYRESGKPTVISTASQLHKAWKVKLNTVSVGGITLRLVDGTVIDTEHDQAILLGMSFLNRVNFSQERGIVVLEAVAQ